MASTDSLKKELSSKQSFFSDIVLQAGESGKVKLTHGEFYRLLDGCIYIPTIMMRTSTEGKRIIEESGNNGNVKRYINGCIHISAAVTDIRQFQNGADKVPFCVFFAEKNIEDSNLEDLKGMLLVMYFYNEWKAVVMTGRKKFVVPEIIQDVLRFLGMRYVQVWTEWGQEHGYKERTIDTSRVYASFIVSGLSNFQEEARDFSPDCLTKKKVFDVFTKRFKENMLNHDKF